MSLPIPQPDALPWQAGVWQRLARQLEHGRLPAGLLVAGAPGVGKRALAQRLVAAMLCERRTDTTDACGQCTGCQQRRAGSHPDLVIGQPEPDKKQLSVDVVREFSRRMFLTSSTPSGRLGLMLDADSMNTHAANALLKTLEEPPPTAHIVLVCDQLVALPATIRSRCQLVRVGVGQRAQARRWLQAQHPTLTDQDLTWYEQRPMQAAQAAQDADERRQWEAELHAVWGGRQDPVQAAGNVAEDRVDDWVEFAFRMATELVRDGLDAAARGRWLSGPVQGQQSAAVRRLIDSIQAALGMRRTQASRRLMAEVVMMEWARAGRTCHRQTERPEMG